MDELIARVAAGDRAAFERLYRALAETAFLVANATLNDSAQAEEVTQEVFLEIWRRADRFEPGRGSAQRWVRTIARNRAIDRVRTAEANRARDHYAAAAEGDEPVDPEQLVMERFKYHQLMRALRLLTVEHRQVLALTYFGELPQSQVAILLGIPLGTVKSRLSAALRHLRHFLQSGPSV